MPGTHDGLALARLAKQHYQNMGVAVMSGRHVADADEHNAFDLFLPKPLLNINQIVSDLTNLISQKCSKGCIGLDRRH